jgi:hypothetical protein
LEGAVEVDDVGVRQRLEDLLLPLDLFHLVLLDHVPLVQYLANHEFMKMNKYHISHISPNSNAHPCTQEEEGVL